MTRVEWITRLLMFSLLFIVAVWYTQEALSFHRLAMYAPLLAGGSATLLLTIIILREGVRLRRYLRDGSVVVGQSMEQASTTLDDDSYSWPEVRSALLHVVGLAGLVVLVWLFGLAVVAPVFVVLFLRFYAKTSWRFAFIGAAAQYLVLYLLVIYAGIYLPIGYLY